VECLDPDPAIREMQGYIINYSPPPYYTGHNLRFSCRSYQRLRGSSNRTCMANGRWSGLDTICDDESKLYKKTCYKPDVYYTPLCSLISQTTNKPGIFQ